MKKDKAIIVFARHPVIGKVKTRLAKTMGDEFAASFYKVCAEHTFTEVEKTVGTGLFLFCSEKNEIEKLKNWGGEHFTYYVQRRGDLGLRMLNAFRSVFKEGHNQAVIIGTDTPDINSGLIQQAFSELNNHEYVIGPSNDGGYYLLGMKSPAIDLFTGIEWSTDSVFNKTIKKFKCKNAAFKVLNVLNDIDTEKDLKKWYNEFSGVKSHPVKVFLDSNL